MYLNKEWEPFKKIIRKRGVASQTRYLATFENKVLMLAYGLAFMIAQVDNEIEQKKIKNPILIQKPGLFVIYTSAVTAQW